MLVLNSSNDVIEFSLTKARVKCQGLKVSLRGAMLNGPLQWRLIELILLTVVTVLAFPRDAPVAMAGELLSI